MNFNSSKGTLKAWTMMLLLMMGLGMNAAGGPGMVRVVGALPSAADQIAPLPSNTFSNYSSVAGFSLDGNSTNNEITVIKKALLNGEPVDEVCGGATVTFEYTVKNNVVMWPAFPPYFPNPVPAGPLYYVNVQDTDPTLGDIDGTVTGVTIQPGGTVVFTKTKTIALGEVSSSAMNVTANYAISQAPSDAVSATDTWTVTGVSCGVEVVKTVSGAPPTGGQSFTFEIRTGASVNSVGTPVASATADAANGGNAGFAANLQAGTQYQFCETNMLPGWTTSLSQVAGAFIPNSAGGNPDNSVVCINFTVTVGEPTVFTVNNTAPVGGPARTIGYWKNWSSCSGSKGKQDPVLDYVLSRFGVGQPALPPDPIPTPLPAITTGVNFGSLNINTCAEAVSILDKSTVGGVKKASHPAYNMAAQLLAVKLNVQAGADPRCILPYVVEAEALLIAIGFSGSGSPSYSVTQGNRMNTLATYFDRYNNGDVNLCPLP